MDSDTRCYLYWIRKNTDTDIFTEGYVGVTINPDARWKSHLYYAKTNKRNHKLYNALRKSEDFSMQIIVCSNVDYCLNLENKLRPLTNIGLNHAEGGRATQQGRLDYNYSSDVKQKISEGVKRAYKENKEFAEKQKICKIGKLVSDLTKERMSSSAKKSDRTKWRNNVADKELWFNADDYYKLFKEDENITPSLFAEKCKLPLGKIGALLKSFRKGWNPTKDKEYIKFKENYYGNRA